MDEPEVLPPPPVPATPAPELAWAEPAVTLAAVVEQQVILHLSKFAFPHFPLTLVALAMWVYVVRLLFNRPL